MSQSSAVPNCRLCANTGTAIQLGVADGSRCPSEMRVEQRHSVYRVFWLKSPTRIGRVAVSRPRRVAARTATLVSERDRSSPSTLRWALLVQRGRKPNEEPSKSWPMRRFRNIVFPPASRFLGRGRRVSPLMSHFSQCSTQKLTSLR